MLTIKINNLNELRDLFAKMPARVEPALKKATIEAGKKIIQIEKKEAPHKTGNLQRSIKMEYRPIAVEINEGIADYAKYLVSGTKAHFVAPVRKQALRFRGSDGKWHYSKGHNVSGIKKNDFVGRTVSMSTEPVNKVFQQALEEITKL